MDDQEQFDQTLNLIYESALTPERLRDALGAITTMLDGDTCHLVGWDRRNGIPSLSISTGLPEEVGPDYAAHYAHIDPRRQLALTMPLGQMLACHEHFDTRFVNRNEFFQDYLLPQVGIHYLLGSGDLLEESEQMIMIGFQRYVGHGPFDPSNASLLQRFLPHLRRSLRMANQIGKQTDVKTFSETALDASNLAALALSFSEGGGRREIIMDESARRSVVERGKMAVSTPRRIARNECESGCRAKKDDE